MRNLVHNIKIYKLNKLVCKLFSTLYSDILVGDQCLLNKWVKICNTNIKLKGYIYNEGALFVLINTYFF